MGHPRCPSRPADGSLVVTDLDYRNPLNVHLRLTCATGCFSGHRHPGSGIGAGIVQCRHCSGCSTRGGTCTCRHRTAPGRFPRQRRHRTAPGRSATASASYSARSERVSAGIAKRQLVRNRAGIDRNNVVVNPGEIDMTSRTIGITGGLRPIQALGVWRRGASPQNRLPAKLSGVAGVEWVPDV